MINLYWPVYKSLEHEILELATKIHIDDNQTSVYSVKISELLIRCVVEIEAIAKELYFMNGGNKANDKDLYYDTDCLNLLEEEWQLSKKQVMVSSSNFYFQNDENKVLTPLKKANKRGSSGSDWARAYQAVKHNRTQNIAKGNIKHLIRATAALFILNLYYRNDTFDLGGVSTDTFSEKYSDLFNVKVHNFKGVNNHSQDSYLKNENYNESMFLIKWTDDYRKKQIEWSGEHSANLNKIIFNHPKVKQYINNNLVENGQIKQSEFSSFIENRDYFKCFDMKTEYGNMINQANLIAKKNTGFDWNKPASFEAVLNRHQKIFQFDK